MNQFNSFLIILLVMLSFIQLIPFPLYKTYHVTNDGVIAIDQLILTLWNHILRRSSTNVFDYYNIQANCSTTISNHLINKSLENILTYSGHIFFEMGKEVECNKNTSYQYYLFEIIFNDKNTTETNEEELAKFLSITSYTIGICVWKDCSSVIDLMLNVEENACLFEGFQKDYQIKELKATKLIDQSYSISFLFSSITIIVYIIIILLIKIVCCLFIREDIEDNNRLKDSSDEKDNKEKEKGNDNEDIENENDDSNENDNDNKEHSDGKIDQDSLFQDDKNKDSIDLHNLEKYMKSIENDNIIHKVTEKGKYSFSAILERFYEGYLSNITSNILFKPRCMLYDSTSLNTLSGVRWIIMLLYTFNHIFYIYYKTPSADTNNERFFTSFLFTIPKLSSFGIHCWVFLDGFCYSYKLMHNIKYNQSALAFLQFYLRNIPRICMFFITFYFIMYNIKDFSITFAGSYQFSQYYKNHYQKECLYNPSLLLFPFKLAYFNADDMGYEKCYSYCYLFINEFWCLALLLALFYIIHRFKSLKVDLCITMVMFINVAVSYFSYGKVLNREDAKTTLLKYILGENLSVMYPHLMFNIIFFGALCGLVYFNYIESIYELDYYLQKGHYFPFNFCNTFMQLLIKQNKIIITLLNMISTAVIILISMLYNIIQKTSDDKTKILLEFDWKIKLLYVYERHVFIFFFGFLILQMVIFGQNYFTKFVSNIKVLMAFDRLSFGYMSLCHLFVVLFLTSFDLQGLEWNYITIAFITFALFVVILFASFLLTRLLEIPLRFLIIRYVKLVDDTRSSYAKSRTGSAILPEGLIPQ